MNDGLPGTNGRRRVYLMRHGEVSYFDASGRAVNPDAVVLTERGQSQARAMAELLHEIPLDRAGHTGLPRSAETARLVLAGHDIAPETHDGLREVRAGRLRDLPPDRVDAEFVYGMERAAEPGARFANGEAYIDFEVRVRAAFEALLLTPGWSRMLMVAHDGTNRAVLGWVTGGGLAAMGAFEQDPGCLNIIDVDVVDGEIVRKLVKALNLTPTNLAKHGNYLTSLEQVFHGSRA
ncbi:MAG: histidine phosphatase family protein [Alphaproteobacteria bacterium]|jgi:probable phosphoglycerate mutase|nr:histidine phosphatase family protein [Alphaproteobacteria bacterium]